MKLIQAMLLGVSVFIFLGCNNKQSAPHDHETAVSGKASVLVDNQIYTLITAAKELYDQANPQAQISLQRIGANDAVSELLQHNARGVIVARDWLPDEAEAIKDEKGSEGYPRTLLAKDALVLFVSKHFPYDTMHAGHVRQWLTSGTFPLFAYPKLTRQPKAVVPGSTSSVYGNVVNVILHGKLPSSSALASLSSTDSVKSVVRDNSDLIGIGLLSQLVHDSTVKMLRISWTDSTGMYQRPRPVHQGYLVQGLYPFPVPVWFVLRDKPNNYNLPSGFMMFLARDGNAQRTFLTAGIEPAFAKFELILQD